MKIITRLFRIIRINFILARYNIILMKSFSEHIGFIPSVFLFSSILITGHPLENYQEANVYGSRLKR